LHKLPLSGFEVDVLRDLVRDQVGPDVERAVPLAFALGALGLDLERVGLADENDWSPHRAIALARLAAGLDPLPCDVDPEEPSQD
jgi:hypothetical protein